MSLVAELQARAAELGFLACGITDPSPPPNGDRLDAWLARGYAGTMRYLHRQARRRKNPRLNVPESLAVVALASRIACRSVPAPASLVEVTVNVAAEHPSMAGMGMSGQATDQGGGKYSILANFSDPGDWVLTVTVTKDSLDYKEEIDFKIQ